METPALILVIVVWSSVTLITGYFFYKVLSLPKHPEQDSFENNDEIEK
ncbi:MAG: hypothetical protein ACK49D_00535 [Flavobacteriia bacterium]|jgi:hypothetical protein|nr:hypothetical protein [Cryomorphaceae bacterium]